MTTQIPYLAGNFAPVRDELTSFDLPITGSLPRELNGRLLRDGPNPIVPDAAAYHWILEDGMVHAIELRDGRALSYRNRWVRTDQACAKLGEQPPAGQPDDVFPVGTANTNLISHGGRILALYEACLPTQITAELDTVGRYDFAGRLRSAMTAHPKVDPDTGELFFFGVAITGPPWLRLHVADPQGNLVRSDDIDVRGPSMMHDFAVTRRHILFLDLPVVYDPRLLGAGRLAARWTPEYGSRVGVMPREGGPVRWFEVETCYVFHTLNAYDDGDDIVVDVVRHPTMFAQDAYGIADQPPTLDRWRIDTVAGKVAETRLDDHSQEFPRIDDRRLGRPNRYGYAAMAPIQPGHLSFGGLIKHDLHQGSAVVNPLGPGNAAGEPIFVSADDGEDDGWVLSVVYDAARDGSDLVICDAGRFAADPVARVHLPQRVPYNFHGCWLPRDE
ncbi:carotenoid cleavage dioxygenase [Nonomuraea solani]|uniref:Dioxygenase n=1 Tax=Nonomuraea solani TaxID=1144553 RepID=A0A1H6F1T2_9ACTN|nr:carotenoid oxygenase family protein [Nonomuraea solani]SEH04118.1 carotenoid cleavage dioxygenase [Nonomuraea solani]